MSVILPRVTENDTFKKFVEKINDTMGAVESTDQNMESEVSRIDADKATKAEVEVERQRINNLTSLPEGSTTGDAELMDIRVGADGTQYQTAGEAVRKQTSDLKAGLNNLLANVNSGYINNDITGIIEDGIGIDARDGNERTDFKDAVSTDYIDVSEPNMEYYYTGRTFYYLGIAGYDSDGTYLQAILMEDAGVTKEYEEYKLEIPSNVKKIRATSYNFDGVLKVEKKGYTQGLYNLALSQKEQVENLTNETSDMKVGYDGTVYSTPGDAVRGQVKSNNDIFYEINAIENVTGETKAGIVIDTRYGTESTKFPRGIATDFIDVSDKLTDYYYTGTCFYYLGIGGYDENGGYICPILSTGEGENTKFTNYKLTIPENVKKIKASSYNSNPNESIVISVFKKYAMKELSNSLRELQGKSNEFSKALEDTNKILDNNVRHIHHLYVSTTGSDTTGDGSVNNPYATIFYANETIEDSNEDNQYIIHVADGIYTDLQQKYAGQASNHYEGVICKDYVSYIGNVEHPEKCIIKWDGSTGFVPSELTVDDVIDKSPFHIVGSTPSQGHVKISGFRFEGNDLRYPIHVETQGRGLNYNWEISHCDFRGWEGRTICVQNGTNNNHTMPSIGMGSTCGEVGKIHDCIFPTRPTSENMKNFSLGIVNHDNVPNTSLYENIFMLAGATYEVYNCDFGGNDILVRSLYDIAYNTPNQIILSNCTNLKTLNHSEGSGITNHWVRHLINCTPESDAFSV